MGTGGWLLVVFGFPCWEMLDATQPVEGGRRGWLELRRHSAFHGECADHGPVVASLTCLCPSLRLCPSSACRKEVYLRLRGDVTPYEIGVFNKTPFSSAPPLEVTEEELAESAATPEHLGDADDASLMAGK